MGTKYSTRVTSGYNATPPSDDGSETEANKVKWSTIKTKLADPDKDRNDLINTDLVEHFDQGPDAKSGAYTTVAADYNTVLEVTGTNTISLGDAATMTAGYFVIVLNAGTGEVTVDLDTAADSLNGTANDSIVLSPQQSTTFIVNSSADGYHSIAQTNDAVITDYQAAARGLYLFVNATQETVFNVTSSVTENTWESIGPTGSGADNIYSSMDSIPSDAKAILIGFRMSGDNSNTVSAMEINFFTRPGSTSWSQSLMIETGSLRHEDDVTGKEVKTAGDAIIGLDPSDLTFDVYWSETVSNNASIQLVIKGFWL